MTKQTLEDPRNAWNDPKFVYPLFGWLLMFDETGSNQELPTTGDYTSTCHDSCG